MVATAGRIPRGELPAGVFHADWLPGLACAERAAAVVCNGGSPMVYQALSRGRPVVGLPVNHDQYYVMEALVRKGAGRLLRAGQVRPQPAREAVEAVLREPSYRIAAQALQAQIAASNPAAAFLEILQQSLAEKKGRP